jgi:multidrug efflux pump subunit AcrB
MGIFPPKVEFFPINEPNYVNVFIEKPVGTDIEVTNDFTLEVEEKIMTILDPYQSIVEAVITNVGEGTSDPMEGPSEGVTPHKARITISFIPNEERGELESGVVMRKIRKELGHFAGVQITVDKDPAGPPMPKPINIEIVGEDFEPLIAISDRIKRHINSQNILGIEELKTDLQQNKPELIVNIDREKARRFGVSSHRIAGELRTALFGKEVSKYKLADEDYPIQLRLAESYRHDLNTLMNQRITFRDQTTGKISQVPISAVATAELSSTYGSVNRKDLDRSVKIFSNVVDGYNANEVVDEIKQSLEGFEIPEGYYYKFTGQQEEQEKEMAFLSKALVIAVFLIFLIIVSQFNSFVKPFIIMGSVLFSTIGVFLGLIIFQMDFIIIMTMMGIISLAGVVVNNAIVLLDYTDLTGRRKKKELGLKANDRLPYDALIESVIQGGKTRLRPVLLTAITTILGLVPLATGMNINYFTLLSDWNPQIYFGGDNVIFWGPLSWTVIFGLTFATFLTLVIVPVMYVLFDRMGYRMSKLFK